RFARSESHGAERDRHGEADHHAEFVADRHAALLVSVTWHSVGRAAAGKCSKTAGFVTGTTRFIKHTGKYRPLWRTLGDRRADATKRAEIRDRSGKQDWASGGMKQRILIVAQDAAVRARLARRLMAAGYAVELAEGAKRAREVVAAEKV